MALLDSDERKILLGVGIGIAGLSLMRQILPAFGGLGRPLAKAAIKSGIGFYEKGRETLARMTEVVEDLAAEARHEMDQEARSHAAATPPPAPPESAGPAHGEA